MMQNDFQRQHCAMCSSERKSKLDSAGPPTPHFFKQRRIIKTHGAPTGSNRPAASLLYPVMFSSSTVPDPP